METKWYFIFPGWFYAGNTPGHHRTEREARAWVRDYYKRKRLPRGTAFWRMT
jgi:hypothetical protein